MAFVSRIKPKITRITPPKPRAILAPASGGSREPTEAPGRALARIGLETLDRILCMGCALVAGMVDLPVTVTGDEIRRLTGRVGEEMCILRSQRRISE